MKLQTKKIVAKEFIVLILTLVITLLAFLGTVIYNAYANNKIKRLGSTVSVNTRLADSLWKLFDTKRENKQWLYDKLGSQVDFRNSIYKSYDILWDRFQEVAERDSV